MQPSSVSNGPSATSQSTNPNPSATAPAQAPNQQPAVASESYRPPVTVTTGGVANIAGVPFNVVINMPPIRIQGETQRIRIPVTIKPSPSHFTVQPPPIDIFPGDIELALDYEIVSEGTTIDVEPVKVTNYPPQVSVADIKPTMRSVEAKGLPAAKKTPPRGK